MRSNHKSMIIYKQINYNLSKPMHNSCNLLKINDNHRKDMKINENPLKSFKILKNARKYMIINKNRWKFMKINENPEFFPHEMYHLNQGFQKSKSLLNTLQNSPKSFKIYENLWKSRILFPWKVPFKSSNCRNQNTL